MSILKIIIASMCQMKWGNFPSIISEGGRKK